MVQLSLAIIFISTIKESTITAIDVIEDAIHTFNAKIITAAVAVTAIIKVITKVVTIVPIIEAIDCYYYWYYFDRILKEVVCY